MAENTGLAEGGLQRSNPHRVTGLLPPSFSCERASGPLRPGVQVTAGDSSGGIPPILDTNICRVKNLYSCTPPWLAVSLLTKQTNIIVVPNGGGKPWLIGEAKRWKSSVTSCSNK